MTRLLLAFLLLLPMPVLAVSTSAQLPYRFLVENDNPMHFWPFDESSGTSASDRCGSSSPADNCGSTGVCTAENGTYTGGFTLNAQGLPGKPQDNYVTLNGSTGYVALSTDCRDYNPLDNNSATVDWSAELWVYSTSTSLQKVLDYGTTNWSTTGVRWVMYIGNSGAYTINIYADGSPCTLSYGNGTGGTYTANAWHHLVMTTTGASSTTLTNIKLYDNGSNIITVTSFSGSICRTGTSYNLAAGRGTDNTSYVTGRVADVALYRVALTAAQVTAHYNIGVNAGGGFPRVVENFVDNGVLPISFALPVTRSRGGRIMPFHMGQYDQ